MWSRRKIFATAALQATPQPPVLRTPAYQKAQQAGSTADFTVDEDSFSFITALSYTIMPSLGTEEAAALLAWTLPSQWISGNATAAATPRSLVVSTLRRDADVMAAVSQVEYFFIGTDNGHVFLLPLLPPHLLALLTARYGDSLLAGLAARHPTPDTCTGRRLLHRHAREEPVISLSHLGTLLASATAAADDTAIAISIFHPSPQPILCLPHPTTVRSLVLWDGSPFTPPAATTTAEPAPQQRWAAQVLQDEPVAAYVITGDAAAVVRLWRVDVAAASCRLQHVLVLNRTTRGVSSLLAPLERDDSSRRVPSRETHGGVYCLALSEEALTGAVRLLAGTEGGIAMWELSPLPHGGAAGVHPLCWDAPQQAPLPCALRRWSDEPSSAEEASIQTVRCRTARLVNHHVWLREAEVVEAQLAAAAEQLGAAAVSPWKSRYEKSIAGGAAVGVVSNDITFSTPSPPSVEALLQYSVAHLHFDDGEVRRELRVPVSSIAPVLYPRTFFPTPRAACFALAVLQPEKRFVSSGSDGRICVWQRRQPDGNDDDDGVRYQPLLVSDARQDHRGLGRQLCVLRSPDIFVASTFDSGVVKEWHIYDLPELLLRCERRFTMTPQTHPSHPISSGGSSTAVDGGQQLRGGISSLVKDLQCDGDSTDAPAPREERGSDEEEEEEEEVVSGVSCMAACPAFGALFLVGVFESSIQTYTISEVAGCEAPRNFIFNGVKTVQLPSEMALDSYGSRE